MISSLISLDQMDAFMQEFIDAMKEIFPQLLVQFEDFSTDNAFRYLDLFRSKYRVFNDDVSAFLSSYQYTIFIFELFTCVDPRDR
jgi:hypothetical protein